MHTSNPEKEHRGVIRKALRKLEKIPSKAIQALRRPQPRTIIERQTPQPLYTGQSAPPPVRLQPKKSFFQRHSVCVSPKVSFPAQ